MNDIFKINSNQKKRLFVVDDFYTNPLAIREHALAQTYFPGEGELRSGVFRSIGMHS